MANVSEFWPSHNFRLTSALVHTRREREFYTYIKWVLKYVRKSTTIKNKIIINVGRKISVSFSYAYTYIHTCMHWYDTVSQAYKMKWLTNNKITFDIYPICHVYTWSDRWNSFENIHTSKWDWFLNIDFRMCE